MLSFSLLSAASVLAIAAAMPAPAATSTIHGSVVINTPTPIGTVPGYPAYTPEGGLTPEPSDDKPANHFCNNFPLASSKGSAVAYQQFLAGLGDWDSTGQVCVGAGPRVCKTLSNNDGAEVVLCNDNHSPKCVDHSDLRFRGAELLHTCSNPDKPWSGQVLFADNTNLLLRAA